MSNGFFELGLALMESRGFALIWKVHTLTRVWTGASLSTWTGLWSQARPTAILRGQVCLSLVGAIGRLTWHITFLLKTPRS